MKVLQVASELYPLAKVGQLGYEVGGLCRALAGQGHQVAVFLPAYRRILDGPWLGGAQRVVEHALQLGGELAHGETWRLELSECLTAYFVRRDEFFDRSEVYGAGGRDYEDNAARFTFFAKAVADAIWRLDMRADVLHAHDWPAALLPSLIRLQESARGEERIRRIVQTLHNLAYQGVFPRRAFDLTNFPGDFFSRECLEYFGQMNFLKGGIVLADAITTLSRQYAREILDADFGLGLENVLASRRASLRGLPSGVEPARWNPARDASLPAGFSAENPQGKLRCREVLLDKMLLPRDRAEPLFVAENPLCGRGGEDLQRELAVLFRNLPARLLILARGSGTIAAQWRTIAQSTTRKIVIWNQPDDSEVRLALAGADFALICNQPEPTPFQAMRAQIYGSVPVASATGGNLDAIDDNRENTPGGTGLLFAHNRDGLDEALVRALALYRDCPALAGMQRRCMQLDNSWDQAAAAYAGLYAEG